MNTVDIPRKLIEELKSPNRKRTVKTILRENWKLVEDVDKNLKRFDDTKILMNLPILVTFILQNFLTTISVIVSPKKVSMIKQKMRNEHEDVLEFEDNLREAQKNWELFFGKYEETIKIVVKIAKEKANVDFHAELWQRTRFQKLVSSITHFSERAHSNTVYYIPPTRFLFALIAFTANWTVLPVVNVSQKIAYKVGQPLRVTKSDNVVNENGNNNGITNGHANGNGIQKSNQNGKEHSSNHISVRTPSKPTVVNENFTKFHIEIQNSSKLLSEKEREWQEKTTQFQKEVRARLEVQEKRLIEEIETFEEEKMERRRQEEEEFQKRMTRQNEDFETLMSKIEEERKALEEEEQEKLFEICDQQDKTLLDLFESNVSPIHWTDHEDYWNDRLQIIRNSLSAIRSEYWNFESYLKQYLAATEDGPNFVKVVYKIESASFGRTVTRAKTIIENEQDFFESLTEKYDDDRFLSVLMKTTSKMSVQLENVILELWNVAVDSHVDQCSDDISRLRSAVLGIDPYSIPTTWRLKGICNSTGPADHNERNENGAVISNGHF